MESWGKAMAEQKRITVYRDRLPIHRSRGHIPEGLLRAGDTIHLGQGTWDASELNWLPMKIEGVTISGHPPKLLTPTEMVERARVQLMAGNVFFRSTDGRS